MGVKEAVRHMAEVSKLGQNDRERILSLLEEEEEEESLEDLSYRELQLRAMDQGIKGNQSEEDLLAALQE